jgi:hypothetical protein
VFQPGPRPACKRRHVDRLGASQPAARVVSDHVSRRLESV